jgi:CPA2 family monovalent cation:H+ antiporter-2
VHTLSELGLIFLLFSIGVEFSLTQLLKIRKLFFLVGGLQVFLTLGLTAVLSLLWGLERPVALVLGLIVSLSSTAIVLKLIHERRELNTRYGDFIVATLLFQDAIAVLFLVLIPYLTPQVDATAGSAFHWAAFGLGVLKSLGILLTVYLGTRFLVPWMLERIARTRVRELFLIFVALLTFGVSYLGELVGISLAMGAFLAGLMISESKYGHQVLADLVPFKEPFVALFFVSVGLLIDVQYLGSHYLEVAIGCGFVLILKFFVGATLARSQGLDGRSAALYGLYLAQIGEFSFVVAGVALSTKILSLDFYQLVLSVIGVSMLLSPSLIRSAPRLSTGLQKLDPFGKILPEIQKTSLVPEGQKAQALKDHVIIVGYGMNGENLGRALKRLEIPYAVVETNPITVRKAQARGEFAVYGDGSRAEVLHAVGIDQARMAVIAINDVSWIAKIVHAIREERPELYLVVRFTYLRDLERVKKYLIQATVTGEDLTARELLREVFLGFGMEPEEAETALNFRPQVPLASSENPSA